MAIYHCSYKVGNKGRQQSAAAKVDYILREGKYSKRADEILFSESGNMPACFRENPRDFWKANDAHSRKNGRVFSELEFALPNEMNREQQVDLARAFARKVTHQPCGENVTLPYAMAIHQGDGDVKNIHCHLVFNDRGNDGLNRDPERWFKRANKEDLEKGGAPKVFGLKKKEWLLQTRADLADVTNQHLTKGGYKDQVDHRSLKEQGIDRIPQIHKGPNAVAMAEKGLPTDRVARWEAIDRANSDDQKAEAALLDEVEDEVAYAQAEVKYRPVWDQWDAEEAERRELDEAVKIIETATPAAKAQKVIKTKKGSKKVVKPTHKAAAEKVSEPASTGVRPKKITEPEDEKAVDPKENETLLDNNRMLKAVLFEYKKLEWERGGSKGLQPERLGAAPKDVAAIKKENELLKEWVKNYKRQDLERDQGKGLEIE